MKQGTFPRARSLVRPGSPALAGSRTLAGPTLRQAQLRARLVYCLLQPLAADAESASQGVDKRLQLGAIGVVETFNKLIVPNGEFTSFVVENGGELLIEFRDDLAPAAVDLRSNVVPIRSAPALLNDPDRAV